MDNNCKAYSKWGLDFDDDDGKLLEPLILALAKAYLSCIMLAKKNTHILKLIDIILHKHQ